MAAPTMVFGANYGPDVDPKRWVVIYPPYIDKTRTEKEVLLTMYAAKGRKIAKAKCVEKPNMKEVFDCVQMLKLQTALELDKAYCRDYWQRGRIRVRLFDDDGKPVREDIPTRRILHAHVAALIPEHRKQMEALHGKQKGGQKGGAAKSGTKGGGGANKQPTGKGAPPQTKKKKKGKR